MAWLFSPAESGQIDTVCRVELLGTRAKGAEAADLLCTVWWVAQERVSAWELGLSWEQD